MSILDVKNVVVVVSRYSGKEQTCSCLFSEKKSGGRQAVFILARGRTAGAKAKVVNEGTNEI
jgi:hypothetical protein